MPAQAQLRKGRGGSLKMSAGSYKAIEGWCIPLPPQKDNERSLFRNAAICSILQDIFSMANTKI